MKQIMQDSNHSINTKIALAGLSHYLEFNDNINKVMATSALAMYIASSGESKTKTIAQIALAIHLQQNPGDTFSAPNNVSTVGSNNSAWGSKIFMMRQMPIRK
jgi:hypothetical protein